VQQAFHENFSQNAKNLQAKDTFIQSDFVAWRQCVHPSGELKNNQSKQQKESYTERYYKRVKSH
jgi:hypothetical protein